MAIDRQDWEHLLAKQPPTADTPRVIYRTVELSQAWEKMRNDLEAMKQEKEQALAQAQANLLNMGAYDHASLAKAKAMVDIRGAEMLLIRNICEVVVTYHREDVS